MGLVSFSEETRSLNAYSRIQQQDVRHTPADERYARYHAAAANKGLLPTWMSCCIAVNCCMGSGFLALPRIFARAGLALSSGMMVAVCCVMTLTTSWEAESMARAEAIVVHRLERAAPNGRLPLHGRRRAPLISNRSFEVTELCRLFGGQKLHASYSGLFLCYLVSTSWAYAFVFAEAMSTKIGAFGLETCAPDQPCPLYRAYALVFLCVVVPISLLEPSEQAVFQVGMTLFRFLIATAMTVEAVAETRSPGSLFEPDAPRGDLVVWGRLGGLGVLLPSAIFALNINGNTPLIAKSMRDRERVDVATTVGLWVPCVMYIFIGASVATTFGSAVPRSANVVWQRFRVDASPAPAALRFLAAVVELFPAADVLSVFPLNTTVIANNVLAVFYGDRIDKMQHNSTIRRASRFVVAVLPIVGACFCSNFTRIVAYTGVLAIAISCIFPPLLSLLGRRACRSEFGDTRHDVTRYSLDGDRLWPKFLVVVAGVAATLLALVLGS